MTGCVPAGTRLCVCVPLLHLRIHEACADMHYITDVVLHDIAHALRQRNDGSRKPGLTAFAALPIQVHFSDVLVAMRNACICLDQRPLDLSSKSVSANIRARFRKSSLLQKAFRMCAHMSQRNSSADKTRLKRR